MFRAGVTKNIAELAFLPFWIYLGWCLLSNHSPSLVIALVLLVTAFFVRRAGIKRLEQKQLTEQKPDTVDSAMTDEDPIPSASAEDDGSGVLKRLFPEKNDEELQSMLAQVNAAQETEELVGTPPNKLPYESLREIFRKDWEEIFRNAQNPELSYEEQNIYLWSYLYRLHHWIYINIGGALSLKPFFGIVNEKPSLMLFTSEEMAADFITANKLTDRDEEVSLEAFILPGTLTHIQGYESQGIEWICFNMGPEGSFGGPINLLYAGYAWHRKNDPKFSASAGGSAGAISSAGAILQIAPKR